MENQEHITSRAIVPLSERRKQQAKAYSTGWKSPKEHTTKGEDGRTHGVDVPVDNTVILEKKTGEYEQEDTRGMRSTVVQATGSGQVDRVKTRYSPTGVKGVRVGLKSGSRWNDKGVEIRQLSGGFDSKTGEPVKATGERVQDMTLEFSSKGFEINDGNGKNVEMRNSRTAQRGETLMRAKTGMGGIVVGDDPFTLSRPGGSKRIPANKAMTAYNSWVYAAVSSIAMDMATIEWRMFQIHDNDDHEELFEHDLLNLLEGVNEFQTGTELRFMMGAHLELTGNCYLLKLDKNKKPVESMDEEPAMLYPLDPGGVTMVFDKTTFPYVVIAYVFTFDGQKHRYEPHQILHIRYPDPTDMFSGIGPVQAIAEWIDVDSFSTEYRRRFFLNGAHVDGMLESDMTAEETIDVLRTSWENAHTGIENSHKTPVLPKGVKYVATAATPKDSQMVEVEAANRDRILAGLKVSKTILGTAESDTNRATAETADYVFAKRTIAPKMKLICAYLNEFLVPLFGDDIYLSYDNPVPEDAEFRTKEMQAVMGSAPVLSANEAREEYMGLGPVEGGDTVMALTTMAPIGTPRERTTGGGGGNDKDDDQEGEDQQQGDDEEDNEDDDSSKAARKGHFATKGRPLPRGVVRQHIGGKKSRGAQSLQVKKDIRDTLAERVAATLAAAEAEAAKRADITKMTHEEYMTVYKEFLSRVDPYEKKIDSLLIVINDRQKEEVLENLQTMPGVEKAIEPGQIFNMKKWVDITIEALKPILLELGNQEGAAATALLNITPTGPVFDSPAAQAALDNSVNLMANSYNETVREALRETLDEGIRNGLGYKELAEKVEDIYAFQNEKAAIRVARTESVRVANFTTKQAWKDSGVVKTVKWYTAEDANVCAYCEALDGKTIGIDEVFFKEGDMIPGKDGAPEVSADYGDVGGPPLHPMCRCYIRPDEVSI